MFCWIWILIAVLLFPVLLFVKQPYGRHSNRSWGPMLSNRTGWFIMELPALGVMVYFLLAQADLNRLLIQAAGLLWCMHYVHRSLIFPFTLKTKGKKMPVLIVVFAICFNLVNGFLNGYWLSYFVPDYPNAKSIIPQLIAGAVVFLAGYVINKYHDKLLLDLRKNSDGGYLIPRGGLFRYVSCPNFFGEIITWVGFLIVTQSIAALTFLVWTMVNLIPRALDHHKWYLKEFEDYPKQRKAVIPYLL